jgi:RNA polymerase sigma factor (TIGR02999 family)
VGLRHLQTWRILASVVNDVSQILDAASRGEPRAMDALFPLVYDELRRLAARNMARERPGQTLDATGLVHEAYLRLIGATPQAWNSRGHFFAAAAEAMRRILVERARRNQSIKHGGRQRRVELRADLLSTAAPDEDVLAVDESLDALAELDPATAALVKLHFYAGLTIEEAAGLLGTSVRTAYRDWSYARAWLYRRLKSEGDPPDA